MLFCLFSLLRFGYKTKNLLVYLTIYLSIKITKIVLYCYTIGKQYIVYTTTAVYNILRRVWIAAATMTREKAVRYRFFFFFLYEWQWNFYLASLAGGRGSVVHARPDVTRGGRWRQCARDGGRSQYPSDRDCCDGRRRRRVGPTTTAFSLGRARTRLFSVAHARTSTRQIAARPSRSTGRAPLPSPRKRSRTPTLGPRVKRQFSITLNANRYFFLVVHTTYIFYYCYCYYCQIFQ